MIEDSKKNQIFDFHRFKQYAKAHVREHRRSYFWFFAVISMIYFLILLMISIRLKYDTTMQMFFMYMGLCTTGSIFAVRYFSTLARSDSALMALMQPVSTFEKWLLAMLTITVAYPIVYTLIFEVMTFPVAWLSQQAEIARAATATYDRTADIERYQLYVPFLVIDSKESGRWIPLMFYAIYNGLASYALTTSIFFKRLPLIKSIALGFALFLIFIFVSIIALDSSSSEALLYLGLITNDNYQGGFMAVLSSAMFWIISPLLMWVASFYALKERDL